MRWIAIAVAVCAAGAHARADAPPGLSSVTIAPGDAEFAPTVSTAGTPLHWASGCVFIRPSLTGAVDVPGALDAAAAGATQAWIDATRSCGYLRFQIEPAEDGEVGLDYVNRIVVREDRWCRPGPPEKCYDHAATALTTLYFVNDGASPNDGVIVDADIELNAVDFALATCDGQPGGCVTAGTGSSTDLQNTLTHELGHVIGLDHTCWQGSAASAPLDGDGVPVPQCSPASSLPPEVKEATMYNFAASEEIKKRTPELDDVDGFCAAYPLASDPGTCAAVPDPNAPDPDPGDGGGCRATRAAPGSLAPVILAFGLVVSARRRRRRADRAATATPATRGTARSRSSRSSASSTRCPRRDRARPSG